MTESAWISNFLQGGGVIISAVATVALAILTWRYVRLTNLLDETRASRGPMVYIDIEPSISDVKLVIGNSGLSPAFNVTFTVADTIPWKKRGFNSLPIIKEGIAYVAPKRVLKFTAGYINWSEVLKSDSRAEFSVTYEGQMQKKQISTFHIDLNQYEGVLLESFKDPAHYVAEAIRNIEKNKDVTDAVTKFLLSKTKRCSFCFSEIPEKAKKCPHCLEFLFEK